MELKLSRNSIAHYRPSRDEAVAYLPFLETEKMKDIMRRVINLSFGVEQEEEQQQPQGP